jgi:hypothetical protein
MNILTDILLLLKKKQYVKELKSNDVFVVGVHEEPDMVGVASPVPYRSVRLAKLSDMAAIPSTKISQGTVSISTSSGQPGDIKIDANFIYICVALNTWKRSTLNSY